MQNLFHVLLILIGAAVALFVAVVLLNPVSSSSNFEASSGQTEPLIPPEIEGFKVERIDRADPIFEGELFSVHASFAPTVDSPFQGAVENLGITLFLLRTAQAANEIKSLLLSGAEETSELTVGAVRMQSFSNRDARLSGLLWHEGEKLYYVLVAGVDSVEFDLNALQQAAQLAATAIVVKK
jgi:hypothetical protein